MKEIKYSKLRQARKKKGYNAEDMINTINPLRIKRGAKPITATTYYKKECGQVPIYLDEIEEISSAVGRTYKIFFEK